MIVASVPHHNARSLGVGLTIEPCEEHPCNVDVAGATSCWSFACPSCGVGGATLSVREDMWAETREVTCRNCGHTWVKG
jgi:hypothetical protein